MWSGACLPRVAADAQGHTHTAFASALDKNQLTVLHRTL
jgi:hypothetical protein